MQSVVANFTSKVLVKSDDVCIIGNVEYCAVEGQLVTLLT